MHTFIYIMYIWVYMYIYIYISQKWKKMMKYKEFGDQNKKIWSFTGKVQGLIQ